MTLNFLINISISWHNLFFLYNKVCDIYRFCDGCIIKNICSEEYGIEFYNIEIKKLLDINKYYGGKR